MFSLKVPDLASHEEPKRKTLIELPLAVVLGSLGSMQVNRLAEYWPEADEPLLLLLQRDKKSWNNGGRSMAIL